MKKVLIMTLEQGENYGGMLQAYALQKTVKSLGYSVSTTHVPKYSTGNKLLRHIIRCILHLFIPGVSNLSPKDKQMVEKNTRKFIRNNIHILDWKDVKSKNFDGYIAGSDQVWRSKYSKVEKYLFDFDRKAKKIRISYAASFGRDDLREYSSGQLKKTSILAKGMDAISVREDSAINLVEEYWGVAAEQHVDPTLLVDKYQYLKLIKDDLESTSRAEGSLFAFVLDRDNGKGEVIDKCADYLKVESFSMMPPRVSSRKTLHANTSSYVLPSVTQWLRNFDDAEFIVTDSFHGTVFSLIFNKPFITIGNESRGLARFKSLLKLFNLEERLVSSADEITEELVTRPIDWKAVNEIKKFQSIRSLEYLTKHLNAQTATGGFHE